MLVNSFFATSPFTYPYPFVQVGPLISVPLILLVGFIGYFVSEFLIEALYICDKATSENKYAETGIQKKMEWTGLFMTLSNSKLLRFFVSFVVSTYFIGAVLLKSIAGSESLNESVSSTLYGDRFVLLESVNYDWYRMGSLLFFTITLAFTFGNIEGANRIL